MEPVLSWAGVTIVSIYLHRRRKLFESTKFFSVEEKGDVIENLTA